MRVKTTSDVARVGDGLVVHAEQRPEDFAELGLASSLLAAQCQRRPALLAGPLINVGEPCNDPVVERVVVLTDVLADVGEKLRAVPFARLDRKAAPQIVVIRKLAAGSKSDLLILTSLRVRQPVISSGYRDRLALLVFAKLDNVLGVPLVE